MFRKRIIAATMLTMCVVGLGVAFAFGASSSPVIAHEDHARHDEKAASPAAEVCPVSGEAITGNEKITYEYKGKTYRFCCPPCVEDFKKDPEKYIEKMNKKNEKK